MPIPTGLTGSEQAQQGGLAAALANLQQGGANTLQTLTNTGNAATGAIDTNLAQAMTGLDPYGRGGGQAAQLLAAYSGASGAPAQQQAFNNFTNDPYAQFLQQQGERGVTRNAAAAGGLGGANMSKDLIRFNQGLSSQGLADQIGQLNNVANRGMNVAGQNANILQNKASMQSNLINNLGQAGAGYQNQFGRDAANFNYNTGNQVAAGRTRAGENIANQISSTASALSNLQNQQGQGVSNIVGNSTGNLAQILSQLGVNQSTTQQQLAALLANISSGAVANIPRLPGVQQTEGQGEEIGQTVAAIASMFSDIRLKENIVPIGKSADGHNLYSWDWNEIGRKMTGEIRNIGVIAQEVMMKSPNAVGTRDGYLTVNYGELS